jgi:hypothetical protein
MSFCCLRSSLGLQIHGPLGLAPKGLQDSAQGFNPGNPQNKWFALKGRKSDAPSQGGKIERPNKVEVGSNGQL